jgi:predicted DNA-binding ribbon-helix-helix protein
MADDRDAGTSALVSRNVTVNGRRTSLRLEPELWESLQEIAHRESVTVNDIVARVDARRVEGGLTSAVRTFVLGYFRHAATERGHANAGHGVLYRLGTAPRSGR